MSEWRDDGEHLWLPMIVELLLSIWLMRMWQSFVLRAPLTSWLMMDLLTPLTIRPFGHHYFHLYLHPLHLHLQVNKIGNIKMCGIRKSTWYKSLVKAKKKKKEERLMTMVERRAVQWVRDWFGVIRATERKTDSFIPLGMQSLYDFNYQKIKEVHLKNKCSL